MLNVIARRLSPRLAGTHVGASTGPQECSQFSTFRMDRAKNPALVSFYDKTGLKIAQRSAVNYPLKVDGRNAELRLLLVSAALGWWASADDVMRG